MDYTGGSPALYYVHADHLGRPARMTAQNQGWVWDVIYSPFGETSFIRTDPATIDIRFPGQWFQLESGLAYNWHRHYDASLGRYVQPDPYLLRTDLDEKGPIFYAQALPSQPELANAGIENSSKSRIRRSKYADEQDIYGYSAQNPIANTDPQGLMTIGPFTPRPNPGIDKCEDKGKKDACIGRCSAIALPTSDFGIEFRRCMLACMSDGKSGFLKWDRLF